MAEEALVALSPAGKSDLITHFGLTSISGNPPEISEPLFEIARIVSSQGIDMETAAGIARSFEERFGRGDDTKARVGKFLNFLRGISGGKEALLDTVKSLGLYSKAELEEYAKETGDWSPFLRRIEKEGIK